MEAEEQESEDEPYETTPKKIKRTFAMFSPIKTRRRAVVKLSPLKMSPGIKLNSPVKKTFTQKIVDLAKVCLASSKKDI